VEKYSPFDGNLDNYLPVSSAL